MQKGHFYFFVHVSTKNSILHEQMTVHVHNRYFVMYHACV